MASNSMKQVTGLIGATETLIPTLIGRVMDTKCADPILADKYAESVLSQLGSDFVVNLSKFNLTNGHAAIVALRGRAIDKWVVEFININQKSKTDITVLHLACALDSRGLRVQDSLQSEPGNNIQVRWIDLDLPEPVELRRKLQKSFPSPKKPWQYILFAESVTGEGWLKNIPSDRPILVVFEGLSMYLDEKNGEEMVKSIVQHFPNGQLVFDVAGSFTKAQTQCGQHGDPLKSTGAEFKWAVDDPKDIEKLDERLRLRDVLMHKDMDGADKVPSETMTAFATWSESIGALLRFDF